MSAEGTMLLRFDGVVTVVFKRGEFQNHVINERTRFFFQEGGTKLLSETLREKGNSVPLFT